MRHFAGERDWEQLHTPKNLACSISIEAAELLELFQWTADIEPADTDRLAEEMADILIYLVRLADTTNIDLLQAAQNKMRANAIKYPVEKSQGNATKSTYFE